MTNPTPTPNQDAQLTDTQETLPGPLRCLSGALISGGFAIALYFLTSSIAQTYGNKPIASTNQTAIQIAIAVRTLVVGMATLATAVFGIIACGLAFVTVYVLVQQFKNRKASSSDTQ